MKLNECLEKIVLIPGQTITVRVRELVSVVEIMLLDGLPCAILDFARGAPAKELALRLTTPAFSPCGSWDSAGSVAGFICWVRRSGVPRDDKAPDPKDKRLEPVVRGGPPPLPTIPRFPEPPTRRPKPERPEKPKHSKKKKGKAKGKATAPGQNKPPGRKKATGKAKGKDKK